MKFAFGKRILKSPWCLSHYSVQEVKIIKIYFDTIDRRSYKANLASHSSHTALRKVGQERTPCTPLQLRIQRRSIIVEEKLHGQNVQLYNLFHSRNEGV
jgi:hypothetical protein